MLQHEHAYRSIHGSSVRLPASPLDGLSDGRLALQDGPPGVEEVARRGLQVRGLHWHADAPQEPLPLHRLHRTGTEGRSVNGKSVTKTNDSQDRESGIHRETAHLNESGRLVERHLCGGNVQSEPGRFLPLQAAGALPPWFSHVLSPTPVLPAARMEREEV